MTCFDLFSVSLFAVNLALGLLANDPVRTDSHSTFIPTVLPQRKLANMLYWFSKVPCLSRMFLNVELKHTWERLAVAEAAKVSGFQSLESCVWPPLS